MADPDRPITVVLVDDHPVVRGGLRALIESFTGKWQPERYEDTYRDELMAVIKAKRKGKDVHVEADTGADEAAAAPDLMTALRESIEASRGGRRRKPTRRSAGGDLDGLSKGELEERARKAKVPGRSKMSKDELVAALRRAA